MYSDFIQYKLADGITEDQLLQAAENIVESWMSKQPGFVGWQINKIADNEFIDVVQWESQAAAKAAEANMKDIPQDDPWFACYDVQSIISKSATEVFTS